MEYERLYSPPGKSKEIWVERLAKVKSIDCAILSPEVIGLWIHWNGIFTQPCIKPREECEGCKIGLPRNGKAFLWVRKDGTGQQMVLELPPQTWRNLVKELGPDSQLRGTRAKFTRVGGKTSGVVFQLNARWEHVATGELPPACDPIAAVQRLWDMVRERHGKKNAHNSAAESQFDVADPASFV